MKVEIWSDVVCPWCYIGKRRFEDAFDLFAHRDDVEVIWRSFQLDPNAPTSTNETMADLLSRKYNMSHSTALASIAHVTAAAAGVGLEYHLDEAKHANSLDAHRLLHLASKHGLQAELKERLMKAYFTEAELLSDHDVLVRLAADVGIDADIARSALTDNLYADDVRIEQQTAAELGVRGVPFFVVDRRYGISGAQPSDTMLDVLQKAWEESHATPENADGDDKVGGSESSSSDACSVDDPDSC